MTHPRTKEIEQFIQSKPVAIFMKGTPQFPQCGFSAHAVECLRAAGVQETDLASFDILSDPEMRNLVKEFSNWPTYPQIYIRGKFVGGSDVISELHERGELKDLLKAE